jgi:hypothetical protein
MEKDLQSFPYPNLESSKNLDLYLYLTSQGRCIGNCGARHSKYNFNRYLIIVAAKSKIIKIPTLGKEG